MVKCEVLYMKNILLFIGPSGSGKTYMATHLSTKHPDVFQKVVTATTRPARNGEIHGIDYLFITKDQFNPNDFAEYEQFGENMYGTPKNSLISTKNLIIAIEPKGCISIVNFIKNNHPEIKTHIVFFNISEEKRIENMKTRGDTLDSIKKRLQSDNIVELINSLHIAADVTFNSIEEISDSSILKLI